MTVASALSVSGAAAWAQAPAAPSSVPIGTALTFVADDSVDGGAKPGNTFRVHLKAALRFGSPVATIVAPAGAPARLVLLSRDVAKDGSVRYLIGFKEFHLGKDVGDLPLAPQNAVSGPFASGTEFRVTTKGAVVYDATGRLRIQIPFPFALSTDAPNGGYTPIPLRTAQPFKPRPKSSPTPTPPPAPESTPSPAPTPSAA